MLKIKKIMAFIIGFVAISGLQAFPGEDLARRSADEIISSAFNNQIKLKELSDLALGMKYASVIGASILGTVSLIALLYTFKKILTHAKENIIQRGTKIIFSSLLTIVFSGLTAGTLLGYKTADLLLQDTGNPVNFAMTLTRLGLKELINI